MKEDQKNLSRRTFLAVGSAAVASSVLVADVRAEPSLNKVPETALAKVPASKAALPGVPVDTDSVQTLTNKTISGTQNTIINIGTEYINIKSLASFPTAPDPVTGEYVITDALDDAINLIDSSPSSGGQILIPRGVWHTMGGHDFADSISIEGVGSHIFNQPNATKIKLKSEGEQYVFGILGNIARFNCSLKNLTVDMTDQNKATGLLMSNSAAAGSQNNIIYGTYLENVGFWGGEYGIRVVSSAALESGYTGHYNSGATYSFNQVVLVGTIYYIYTSHTPSTDPPSPTSTKWTEISRMGNFECILNVFNRVTLGCNVGFYCETNNSGFEFNTPYVYLNGRSNTSIGFHAYIMGSLTVNNHHCVGPNINPNDNTTLLRTTGVFNTIVFQNGGQDENIQYLYQNSTNDYSVSPIVFRNCFIQSKVKVTADTAFVSDSNFIVNVAAVSSGAASPTFFDSNTLRNGDNHGWLNLYLMGKNAVESRDPATQIPVVGSEKLAYFTNCHSRIIDPFGAPRGRDFHSADCPTRPVLI